METRRIPVRLWLAVAAAAACFVTVEAAPHTTTTNNNNPSQRRPLVSIRLPGRRYEEDDDDFSSSSGRRFGRTRGGWQTGMGREFDFFDTRGGQEANNHHDIGTEEEEDLMDDSSNDSVSDSSDEEPMAPWAMKGPSSASHQHHHRRRPNFPSSGGAATTTTTASTSSSTRSPLGSAAGLGGGSTSTSSSGGLFGTPKNNNSARPTVFQSAQDWWTTRVVPTTKHWPRIQCRVEPTTTLKIRKTFRPLKTIVRLGADFNTQLGVWQFKSSWEDAIIGGKITLAGRELQLSKSWQLSVGAVEDLVTRLRFRAAVDLQTWKAYARVGFRTERLSPINIMEGFTLLKQLPLDGNRGNVKLEVKANFALPEPEIEYSTESHRSLVGMGDIEINIDELNLVLDY